LSGKEIKYSSINIFLENVSEWIEFIRDEQTGEYINKVPKQSRKLLAKN